MILLEKMIRYEEGAVMKKYVISISRQFGSLGRPIAKKLSELLNINYYDREIVDKVAKKHNLSIKEVSDLEEKAMGGFGFMKFPLGTGTNSAQDGIFEAESMIIRELAEKESCIIVGRCADAILEDNPDHISIFIYAPYEDRIVNCVNDLGMDTKSAKKMIAEVDRARDAYHMRYAKYLPNDINHIDLMINSGTFGVNQTAIFLAQIIKERFSDTNA